jgi:hypothetical protein
MTLQEFCFKHKIVAGGAEFRRLLAMDQIKVNGVAVNSGDIEIHNGDIVQKGKRWSFVKAETIQEGINRMPPDLKNMKWVVVTDGILKFQIHNEINE